MQPDPMPVLVIDARNPLAVAMAEEYQRQYELAGLTEQAAQMGEAAQEIRGWQARNPSLLKFPDSRDLAPQLVGGSGIELPVNRRDQHIAHRRV
jgi:hypothetical protein